MFTRTTLLAGLVLCGTLAGVTLAAAPGAPAATSPAAPGAGGPPARGGRGGGAAVPAGLGTAMQDLNRMLLAVQRESADPEQLEAALRDIALMQRDVAISKTQTPPTVNRIADAAEKAKAIAKFRAQCNDLTKALHDLEDAVNAKKPDDVKKAIAKAIEIGNAAHKDYNVNAKIGQ